MSSRDRDEIAITAKDAAADYEGGEATRYL